jgi:hypothetical protein
MLGRSAREIAARVEKWLVPKLRGRDARVVVLLKSLMVVRWMLVVERSAFESLLIRETAVAAKVGPDVLFAFGS